MIVIVTTGASCVGELLKVNNSLQELDMMCNPIGDDGISSIADGLQCNNSLIKLDVDSCGFSVKGTVHVLDKKMIYHWKFSRDKISNIFSDFDLSLNSNCGFEIIIVPAPKKFKVQRSNR